MTKDELLEEGKRRGFLNLKKGDKVNSADYPKKIWEVQNDAVSLIYDNGTLVYTGNEFSIYRPDTKQWAEIVSSPIQENNESLVGRYVKKVKADDWNHLCPVGEYDLILKERKGFDLELEKGKKYYFYSYPKLFDYFELMPKGFNPLKQESNMGEKWKVGGYIKITSNNSSYKGQIHKIKSLRTGEWGSEDNILLVLKDVDYQPWAKYMGKENHECEWMGMTNPEEKWIPKENDWVVYIGGTAYDGSNAVINTAYQIESIRDGNIVKLKGIKTNPETYSSHIRKALPHEIPTSSTTSPVLTKGKFYLIEAYSEKTQYYFQFEREDGDFVYGGYRVLTGNWIRSGGFNKITVIKEVTEQEAKGIPLTKQESKYEYEVVHCKTEEELKFAISKGLYNVYWLYNKENTCLNLNGKEHSSLSFYKSRNAKIYSFNEWCSKFGHTFKEEEKTMSEYVECIDNSHSSSSEKIGKIYNKSKVPAWTKGWTAEQFWSTYNKYYKPSTREAFDRQNSIQKEDVLTKARRLYPSGTKFIPMKTTKPARTVKGIVRWSEMGRFIIDDNDFAIYDKDSLEWVERVEEQKEAIKKEEIWTPIISGWQVYGTGNYHYGVDPYKDTIEIGDTVEIIQNGISEKGKIGKVKRRHESLRDYVYLDNSLYAYSINDQQLKLIKKNTHTNNYTEKLDGFSAKSKIPVTLLNLEEDDLLDTSINYVKSSKKQLILEEI